MTQEHDSKSLPHLEGGQVVHLAGALTGSVIDFVGPLTTALAEAGARQVLLAHEPADARLIERLDPSVELVLMRGDQPRLRRWMLTLSMVRSVLGRATALRAVHLHGFLPSLIAPYALRRIGQDVPLVYSPHSSKAIGSLKLLGRPLWWLTRPLVPRAPKRARAIANVTADVGAWRGLSHQAVDVVESPIAQEFFSVDHREAAFPLVVTGGSALPAEAADVLAQLQVLLHVEASSLRFAWIGATPGRPAAERLRAAGIESVEAPGAIDRSRRLAEAWAYFAPADTVGFPTQLGEAMAAGLPCLALDTPYHRSLIREGETGLLFRTVPEAVSCLARLTESSELRHRLGSQARREASSRFTERRFRDSLFAAYEQSVSNPVAL